MTVLEIQKQIEAILEAGGCETPAFDAVCILEDIGGIGRGNVLLKHSSCVQPVTEKSLLTAAKKRAEGVPLQYLLGTWDFLSLTLEVGEGVLIPRPETELLCQLSAEYLRNTKHKTVFDLCAGSGCVGLGITSLCEGASVTAVEWSKEALAYLEKNLRRYPSFRVKAVHADVLNDFDQFKQSVDAIVSNPPYIPSAELNDLQREVQHEPRVALDGKDGYVFYRAIVEHWISKLNPGGFVAVEVGIGQAQTVSEMFSEAGLCDVTVHNDFADIPRVVTGRKYE